MEQAQKLTMLLEALGLNVGREEQARLLGFLDELLRWNQRVNLTAITDPDEGLEKHLVDSLTLLPLLRGDERIVDLGSGGGFPGLPLKIARPGLEVVSVDAVLKKISFQRHIVRLLGMTGFSPVHGRAEALGASRGYAEGFEVVVSRAFASLSQFARLARPLLAAGGFVVAMKGPEGETEATEQGPELARLGLSVTRIYKVALPLSGAKRTLLVLRA